MKKRRKRAKRGQTKGKKRVAKEEKEGCKLGPKEGYKKRERELQKRKDDSQKEHGLVRDR